MNIVSFNVNSIRQRQHQLEKLVAEHAPEVIGLQETKVTDEDFPRAAIESLGYHVEFFGQKTHYGVALLSKAAPLAVYKGFPGDAEDAQRRLIIADYPCADGGHFRVINGYFPQGEARTHAVKFPAKEKFYADLDAYLDEHCAAQEKLLVIGDFNIAPVDADIGIGEANAKRWLRDGKTSFLPEEREWYARLVARGLVDTYRQRYPDSAELFSWFDYRSRGFEREPRRGLRIDHILASPALAARVEDAGIDYQIRGMPKPSDHAPVWTRFAC